jgi:hypothetical protein
MPHPHKRSPAWVTLMLFLVPVSAYAISMILVVFEEAMIRFGRVDLGVLLLVLGYLFGAVVAVGWRPTLRPGEGGWPNERRSSASGMSLARKDLQLNVKVL